MPVLNKTLKRHQTLPATTETFAKLRAAGWKPKAVKAKKA